MRSFLMLISGLVVVFAIGGAVYYFLPQQPVNPAESNASVQQATSADTHVLVVPAGNPLLTASRAELEQWVSLYPIRCGEIVFEKVDAQSRDFNFCIGEIRRRVAHDTGTAMSREDVLDANVRGHYLEVMRAK